MPVVRSTLDLGHLNQLRDVTMILASSTFSDAGSCSISKSNQADSSGILQKIFFSYTESDQSDEKFFYFFFYTGLEDCWLLGLCDHQYLLIASRSNGGVVSSTLLLTLHIYTITGCQRSTNGRPFISANLDVIFIIIQSERL